MLLSIKGEASVEDGLISVKRPKDKRTQWMEYYKSGGRIAQIAVGCITHDCYLLGAPVETGATLHLKVQPLQIVEVWTGLESRLSSLYVRVNGKTVIGEAMNGWKWKETETPPTWPEKVNHPSDEARHVIAEHLRKTVFDS